MINYQFTNEDVVFVEKAIELKNKGYYIDGKQLTDVYNRVLNKRVNVTNCGSCIRQRICELEAALNHFKQKMANEAIQSQLDGSNETLQTISSPSESIEEQEPRPSKGLEGNEVALPTVTKEDKNKAVRKKK